MSGDGHAVRTRHAHAMRLSVTPFIGRWLLQVPPLHAVRGRGWGLYAQTQGQELAA